MCFAKPLVPIPNIAFHLAVCIFLGKELFGFCHSPQGLWFLLTNPENGGRQ